MNAVRRFAVLLALASAALCLAATPARATTFVVPTDAELVAGSRAVVEGTVVEIRSRRSAADRTIYTYITIEVARTLAGDVEPGRIVLKEMGGEIGDDFSIVWGTPRYTMGEHVLVYLNSDGDGALHTAFMQIGKFAIEGEGSGQRVVRASGGEGVSAFPSDGGGSFTDTAAFDAYVSMIEALDRSVARKAPESYRAEPAELATPVAAVDEQHHEAFTLLAGHPRWFEPDDGQPVPYYYRPTSFLLDGGQGAVADALAAWSTVEGCSLGLYLADDTELCGYVRDGASVVSFDDCRGQVDGGGCFGVIAVGGASGRSDERKTVNGVEFVRITEGDVVMNNGQQTCLLGHRLTIREILTHELGHSIGLGHSSDTGPEPNPRLKEATMYYALHDDGRAASLKPDDIDAVRFVYPGTLAPPAIVTASLPDATIGAPYSAALEATHGLPPYAWTLTSGVLPPGLSLGADGSIAGTPNAHGSSTFTVTVTDANSRAASVELTVAVAGPKPTVASARYKAQKDRLEVVVAPADAGAIEVRINGVTVAPPARIKRKAVDGGVKLVVKGSAGELNITGAAGANVLVIVADGVASDPFAF